MMYEEFDKLNPEASDDEVMAILEKIIENELETEEFDEKQFEEVVGGATIMLTSLKAIYKFWTEFSRKKPILLGGPIKRPRLQDIINEFKKHKKVRIQF